MTDFEEHLDDTRTCVVAFAAGGGEHIPGVPSFEFGSSLARLGVSYVLMRDGNDSWYDAGVRGIGNRDETAAYVARLKDRYDRVVTTGVSFGSYGAMLYGALARVHEIIAISPLSVIGPRAVAEFEERWHHRIQSPRDLDLKPLYSPPPVRVRAFVTDGDGAEIDLHMAQRLNIPDIVFVPGHTHSGLAKHLRNIGLFEELYP